MLLSIDHFALVVFMLQLSTSPYQREYVSDNIESYFFFKHIFNSLDQAGDAHPTS